MGENSSTTVPFVFDHNAGFMASNNGTETACATLSEVGKLFQ